MLQPFLEDTDFLTRAIAVTDYILKTKPRLREPKVIKSISGFYYSAIHQLYEDRNLINELCGRPRVVAEGRLTLLKTECEQRLRRQEEAADRRRLEFIFKIISIVGILVALFK